MKKMTNKFIFNRLAVHYKAWHCFDTAKVAELPYDIMFWGYMQPQQNIRTLH